MKKLFAFIVLAFGAVTLLGIPAAPVWAQCNGVFDNNTVCGNITGSANLPRPTNPAAFQGSAGGTNGQIQYNNSGALGGFTAGQDCTITPISGAVNCTKLQNVSVTTTGASTNDVMYYNGTGWLHNTVIAVLDAFCTASPTTCTTFFGYTNVRWYGAVGDGTTDSGALVQNAVNAVLSAYGGGRIYFPAAASVYCFNTGVSVNTGNPSTGSIIFEGAAGPISGVAIATCGNNTTPVFTLNNQWIQLRNMTIYGHGALTNPFPSNLPTQPAVLLNSGCSQCHLSNLYVTGGTAAIQLNGASGYVLDNIWASFTYGDGVHANGFLYTINGGGTIRDSHFDMVFPVSEPAHGAGISGWTAATAYTTGTIVSVSCAGRTFWIQAANNGTSGGAQPSCNRHGLYSTDNVTGSCPAPSVGVCWLLVSFPDSYGIQIDTGSIEVNLNSTDVTAATNYAIGITNTFAGQAPQQIHINPGNTPGGSLNSNVRILAGSGIDITALETSYCTFTGCAGVLIDNAAVSNVNINGIRCINNFTYCVDITAAASNILVTQMRASGADTADFNVAAAATGFMLTNSIHISGAGNLFTVAAVAADHYIFANNVCNGAASSDGGTGTHKTVTACAGAGP